MTSFPINCPAHGIIREPDEAHRVETSMNRCICGRAVTDLDAATQQGLCDHCWLDSQLEDAEMNAELEKALETSK